MGRRLIGVALLVLAVMAASVLPAAGGKRIAGEAVAAQIAPPPQVGDCLASRNGLASTSAEVGFGISSDYATVDCGTPHLGEVIGVGPRSSYPLDSRGPVTVPDLGECIEIANGYLGVAHSLEPGDRSPLLGPWRPASTGRLDFLGPDALQQRAGQDWLACVLVSRQGRVSGSVAGMYAGPARVNSLATCRPDVNVRLDLVVPCREPHAMEVFGWRVADETSGGQRTLDASCRLLVERLTAMPDPTAGGALEVRTVILHLDHNGVLQDGYPPVPGNGTGRAICTVAAAPPRMLDGSLTGLGDGPVPLAG